MAYNPSSCCVDRRDGEVSCLDLPHLHSVKPVVWLHPVAVAIVRPGAVDHMILEEAGVLLKFIVLEPSSNLRRIIKGQGQTRIVGGAELC